MVMISKFILVDDDPINNMISNVIINKVFPDAEVVAFTSPKEGLEYINTIFTHQSMGKNVLFLDINMPELNGWEFIDQLEQSQLKYKEHLRIYILSSSVNPDDLKRTIQNPHISAFIEKPITYDFLNQLAQQVIQ